MDWISISTKKKKDYSKGSYCWVMAHFLESLSLGNNRTWSVFSLLCNKELSMLRKFMQLMCKNLVTLFHNSHLLLHQNCCTGKWKQELPLEGVQERTGTERTKPVWRQIKRQNSASLLASGGRDWNRGKHNHVVHTGRSRVSSELSGNFY